MRSNRYRIVNVFSDGGPGGNPLAVVLDAGGLTDEEMQTIAREMNLSETTFVLGGGSHGFNIRIFTPAREIPFAGHPILGTAFVLREEYPECDTGRMILHVPAGPIPVRWEERAEGAPILWMQQNTPEFGGRPDPSEVAAVLGLDCHEIDNRFPVEEVSTGLPFIIVPLTGISAVRRVSIDTARYRKLIAGTAAKAIFVFSAETCDPGNDLHARMFAEFYGVPEDPATGSANGCLAAWLLRHHYFGTDIVDCTVEQGYEMQRPSLLRIRAEIEKDVIRVKVGGMVSPSAAGRLG